MFVGDAILFQENLYLNQLNNKVVEENDRVNISKGNHNFMGKLYINGFF